MAQRKQSQSPVSPWDTEVRLLAWLALCVSVVSFLFYYQRGEVLLYGDAIAHLNIARRVFDSKTPGLLQLGTVWLPLPHLLMIPFLLSDRMWQSGLGGSIPSMAGYVFAVAGIFRLGRGALWPARSAEASVRFPAQLAAWTAALVFAANPNLIYLQATAMGESLYLAFFVWSVLHFREALDGKNNALMKCGACLAGACLTRYDGWFLAVAMAAAIVLLSLLGRGRTITQASKTQIQPGAVVKFALIAAAAPALWLAYNGIVYRNPLEFANGPYSARAIERKTQSAYHPGHPGSGNPVLAGQYFVKSAEANLAEHEWVQRGWLLLLAAGVLVVGWRFRSGPNATAAWPLLFLFVPVPFYALSVAYGGVPIFIPQWWPFSHYNVRYGLQLLPAFAVAVAMLVYFAVRAASFVPRVRMACVFALFAFVVASYASVWSSVPVSLAEAQINMRARKQFETQLAKWLQKLPPDATLLMYTGDHVGALQYAGIPLDHVINEGNHRVWKQPDDPDGLWERALKDPSKYADFVIAFEGDAVWNAVSTLHLPELVEIHVTGQARAVVYRAR